MKDSEISKAALENFLSKVKELSHLRVRSRGNTVTLESADEYGNIYPHVRFKKQSVHKWSLEMPVRSGWEPTFIEDSLMDLMKTVIEKFPWALDPR